MALVFLLGPSMWEPGRAMPHAHTPMQIRRQLGRILRQGGHTVLLMEDAPDIKGEDLIQKFDRLLRQDVTDIIVYWPPLAKMQTTYDELILLRDRHGQKLPCIWVVHHVSVASIREDEFKVLEPGNRSRYLTAVTKLCVHPVEWESDDDLYGKIRLLSAQL